MMKYWLALTLLAVALSSAQKQKAIEEVIVTDDVSRFLLSTTTSTITTYLTTSATCSFSTSCASTSGAVTQCRRRRNVEEIPTILGDVKPSKPLSVETTAAPSLLSQSWAPSLESSNDPKEVLVSGLGSCASGRNFGITVIFTTSVTSSTSCGASTTTTNRYTIAGCTPSGIAVCP